jgi:protein-S-isoprenylcysteine O-methyltransferase Ste14
LLAWLGTALTFLLGQGGGIVLLPYAFTHWQPGAAWPLAVRALGVALITVGGIVLISGFIRFAIEGVGALQPLKMPESWRLTFGGPYRYMRNPLYLAIVMAVAGQALLLSRPVLLAYAAVLLAAFVVLVRIYEEPSMASRFGAEYEAYRRQVPGWWPRRPRRTS